MMVSAVHRFRRVSLAAFSTVRKVETTYNERTRVDLYFPKDARCVVFMATKQSHTPRGTDGEPIARNIPSC